MLLRAFAKINLDLKILGRRPDGYHEIRTILQTIDWFDEIRIERADRFKFACTGGSVEVPGDEGNLVVRAVREFEKMAEPVNARITLSKSIPSGAGLGGGSADAAVTLLGLQRLYGRALAEPDMLRCMRNLGSDVPFFAIGGCATGIGRGDEVVPNPEADTLYWLVVVFSGIRISTAEAYSWLTVSRESNTIKGFGAQFASSGCQDAGLPGNDFESAVFERHPVLEEIKNELRRLGAVRAALSGSGSAVFGRFDREEDAWSAASDMARYGTARVARPLERAEYLQSVFVGET